MATNHHTPERRLPERTISHARTLKVRKGSYIRTIKDKNHSHFNQTVYAVIPWINLQGQWLERAGLLSG